MFTPFSQKIVAGSLCWPSSFRIRKGTETLCYNLTSTHNLDLYMTLTHNLDFMSVTFTHAVTINDIVSAELCIIIVYRRTLYGILYIMSVKSMRKIKIFFTCVHQCPYLFPHLTELAQLSQTQSVITSDGRDFVCV